MGSLGHEGRDFFNRASAKVSFLQVREVLHQCNFVNPGNPILQRKKEKKEEPRGRRAYHGQPCRDESKLVRAE